MEQKTLKPSNAQIKVNQAIQNNCNIVLNAVAGSGKTTTCLYLAHQNKNKKFLLLTFNKTLTDETTKKVVASNLTNIDASTIHKFVKNYSKKDCHNNEHLESFRRDFIPNNNFINYDVIIIDEAQDLNSLMYEVLLKILKTNYSNSQLVILGDLRQCINQHIGSNNLIFKNSKELFNLNNNVWKIINLNTSYRISKGQADFLNDVFYEESDFINSHDLKNENSVEYFFGNISIPTTIYDQYSYIFEQYKPEEIFIIANSVNVAKRSPLSNFLNFLKEKDIIIHRPKDDLEESTEIEFKNKVSFSTYNQSKGREKKVVFLFGANHSYFENIAKKSNPYFRENKFYVGLTRGKEKTIILNNLEEYEGNVINADCPFLFYDFDKLKKYFVFSKYINSDKEKIIQSLKNLFESKKQVSNNNLNEINKINLSVTNLLKITQENEIYDLIQKINCKEYDVVENFDNSKFSDLPLVKLFKNSNGDEYYENVSALNGIFFPLNFQYETNNLLEIKNYLKNILDELSLQVKDRKNIDFNILSEEKTKIEELYNKEIFEHKDILYLANVINCVHEGLKIDLNQIKDFNWILETHKNLANMILKNSLSKEVKYELPMENKMEIAYHGEKFEVNLASRIDAIDIKKKTVYEFKFLKKITTQNKLQLLIYKWLMSKINIDEIKIDKLKFKILNIRTNRIYELSIKTSSLNELVKKIFINYFNIKRHDLRNEEEHYKSIKKIYKRIINE